MTRYLVDTNVISAVSPPHQPAPDLAAWLIQHSDDLYLSTVTIAEIEAGIAKILFIVFLIGAIITFLVGRTRV